MADSTPFRRHPDRYIADEDAAVSALLDHLGGITGHFDRLSADTDPGHVTAADLVAVSMLGLPIPTTAAAWILGEEGQWLTAEILADVPTDADLWNCQASSILRAADLFRLLRADTSQLDPSPGEAAMGQATATRLLAAKRPRLVPIDDRRVRDALRYPKDTLWFRRWQNTLDDALLDKARSVRSAAAEVDPFAATLSELRVIDAVVRRRLKKPRNIES